MSDDKSMPPILVPIKLGPTQVNTSLTPPKGVAGNGPKAKAPAPRRGGTTSNYTKPSSLTATSKSSSGRPLDPIPEMSPGPIRNTHPDQKGLGLPRPPTITDPATLPGTQVRGTALVTVVSVDDPNHPKYAVVAVNNKYPFEGGYLLPAGSGPFQEGPPGVNTTSHDAVATTGSHAVTPNSMSGIKTGTKLLCDQVPNQETVTVSSTTSTTFTANWTKTHAKDFVIESAAPTTKGQVAFYYYDNPVTLIGGSICHADLDRKVILSFTGDVSTTAPTPYYKAIADHRHDGNLNPDGFDNADPVNVGSGEIVGNLPWSNNSTILYGVVDSDGNVIGTDFPDGGLTHIVSGTYKGLYRQDKQWLFDGAGFDMASGEWLWVDWIFKQATSGKIGPMFSDGNDDPINTTLTFNLTAGTNVLVTPVDMGGIYDGLIVTISDGTNSENITVSGSTSTTFIATTLVHNYSNTNTTITTLTPPSNFYEFEFQTSGTTTLKFFDNNGNLLQSWSMNTNTLQSRFDKTHILHCGIQYVGGTTFRLACYYDNNQLIDIVDDSSGHVGKTIGTVIFPGFYSNVVRNTYFRDFDYKTTIPATGLSANPNPTLAPVLNGTPTFTLVQNSGGASPTFDEEVTFDLDANGHLPLMGQWGGRIQLQARQYVTSGSPHAWQEYGYLYPTKVGTSYKGSWGSLGVGTAHGWELGLAYIDQNGNPSPTLALGTIVDGTPLNHLVINRSLASPVIDGAHTTVTNGTTPIAIASDVVASLVLSSAPVTPQTSDYMKLAFHYRVHGVTPWTPAGEVNLAVDGSFNILVGSTNPYVYEYVQLHNGVAYDLGVAFSGDSGYSPIVSFQTNYKANDVLVHGRYMDHGSAVASPNITSPTLANTYSDSPVSSTVTFSFTPNNQPFDGTLGRIGIWGIHVPNAYNSGWSSSPRLWAELEAFGNNSSPVELSGADPSTLTSADATYTYTPSISNISSGIHMVFFATFMNNNGRETPVPSFFRYTSGTTSAGSGVTVTMHGSGHAGLNVGDQVAFVNYGVGDGVKEYTTVISIGTNTFTCNLSNSYSDGTLLVKGKTSGFIGALTTQPIIMPGGSQPSMPTGMSVSASVTPYTYEGEAGGAYHTVFTITPTLSGGSPEPVDGTLPNGDPFAPTTYNGITYGGWGAEWVILQRTNDTGTVNSGWTNPHKDYSITGRYINSEWGNGNAFEIITAAMGANHAYQLAACPVDKFGAYGPIYIFPNLTTPQGFGDTPNLVVDSNIVHVKAWVKNSDGSYTAGDRTAHTYNLNIPYWSFGGNLTLTEVGGEYVFGVIEARSNLGDGPSQSKGANCFYLTPDGDRGTYYFACSEPIHLKSGVEYCLSGYIDATGCGASSSSNPTGAPYWAIRDTSVTWDPYHGNNTALLATASQAFGQLGTVNTTYTPTSDKNVVVMFCSHGCKVNSNILAAGKPMLQVGSFPGVYSPGPAVKKHRPSQDPNANDLITNPVNGDGGFYTYGGFADPQNGAASDTGGGGYHHHAASSWQTRTVLTHDPDPGDGLFISSGQVNDRHINTQQIKWKHMKGDTSGDSTTNFVDGSNKRFLHTAHSTAVQHDMAASAGGDGTYLNSNILSARHHLGALSTDTAAVFNNDGTTSRMLHTRHSTGVQAALDSTGNFLNVNFSGAKVAADGALTNLTANYVSTEPLKLVAGSVLTIECHMKLGATTANALLGVSDGTSGSVNNGYGLFWGTAGGVQLFRKVSNVYTALFTGTSLTQDTTAYRPFKITITVNGASNNTIEGSFDGQSLPPQTDTNLDLTSGTWYILCNPASSTISKVLNLRYLNAAPHYGTMHISHKSTHSATASGDGLYLNSGQVNDRHINTGQIKWKHFLGDTSGDSATNIVDTNQKRFLHTAMSTGVQGSIDSSSNILNNAFNGVKTGTDGTMTGVNAGGTTLSVQSHTFAAGQKITISGRIKSASTSWYCAVGTSNANYYRIVQDTSNVRLSKNVAGSGAQIGTTIKTQGTDTNWHSFQLTITCNGASNNTIEGSFDDATPQIVTGETSLDMTAGSWFVILQDQGSGTAKWSDIDIDGARPHHTLMSAGVQGSIDASSNIMNLEWPGAKLDTQGRLQMPTGVYTQSNVAYTLTQGTPFQIDYHIQHTSASSDDMRLHLGTSTNSYFLNSSAANSVVRLGKIVAGVTTIIHDIAWTPTLNPQHVRFTITPGASTNTIEFSFDGNPAYTTTDNSLTLTTGTWPITVNQSLVGDRWWHFDVKAAQHHHSRMSGPIQHDMSATAGGDGTYLNGGILTKRHHSGALSTDTNPAFDNDGTNTHLRYDTHHASVRHDLASSAAGDGTYLNSGILTGRHHSGALSTDTSATMDNDGTTSHLLYSRHHASVRTVFGSTTGVDGLYLNSGQVNDRHINAGQIEWKHFKGDTSGDTTTSMVDTNQKRFLHAAMSTGVQTAIDSSGNLLNVSWTGIKVGSGGAMSGFANGSGTASSNAFTVKTGHIIAFECSFQLAGTTTDHEFIFGTTTNGYSIYWNHVNGAVTISKNVAGVLSVISTITTVTMDTAVHSLKLTVTAGATNKIEGSFDNVVGAIQSDSSLTLTSGTWPFSIVDGDNGTEKIWNFQAYSSAPHRSHVHSDYQNTVNTGGGIDFSSGLHTNKNQDNIADGATYGRTRGVELISGTLARLGTGKNHIGNPSFELNDMGTSFGVPLASGATVCNGWVVNQTQNIAVAAPMLDNTSGFSQSGNNCLLIRAFGGINLAASSTSAVRVFSPFYPIKVGDVVALSAYTRSDNSITGGLPAGVTVTQRVAYYLYDSTKTHSQEFAGNPFNAVYSTTGGTGAYTQTSNTATIPATITGGFVPAFIVMQCSGFFINGNGSLTAIPAGNFDLRYDDIVLSVQNTYKENSPEIQTVIDSSSNILNTEFTNAKLSTGGVYTGFSGVANLSKDPLPTLVAGDQIEIEGQMAIGSAGISVCAMGIADNISWSNGYMVRWNSGGQQQIAAQLSGAETGQINGSVVTQDTSYHGFHLTIKVNGASNNTIEGSIGNDIIGPTVDTHVDLTSGGPWFFSIWAGGTPASTKVRHIKTSLAQPHHSRMSKGTQAALDSSGNGLSVQFVGTKFAVADDTITGVNSATGNLAIQSRTYASSEQFTMRGKLKIATGTPVLMMGICNGSAVGNSYSIRWGSGGNAFINKYVGGTNTSLGNILAIVEDTNWHSFSITVTCNGASNNTIEASFNNAAPLIVTDTSLDLTTGSWSAFLYDANNGTTKFSDIQIEGARPHHTRMSAGTQAALDSGGNILNVEFPGLKINSSHEYTNFSSSNWTLSGAPLPTLVAGDVIEIDAILQRGGSTNDVAIGIVDTSAHQNFYRLLWQGSTGVQKLDMNHGGVIVTLLTGSTVTTDTNYHGYKFTLTVNGASNNTVEGSIGTNLYNPQTDTNLDLTTGGPYYVFVNVFSATGLAKHIRVSLAQNHYNRMHKSHTADHDYTAGGDGTYLKAGKLTKRHHSGALSTDTNPAFDNDGTNSHLRYDTHHASVQHDLASTAGGDGTYLNSGLLTGRHHLGGLSTDTSAVMDNDGTTSHLLYTRHHASVRSALQSTADSDGTYLTHGQIRSTHLVTGTTGNAIDLDTIPDGRATYSRVKATEQDGSGHVKQLNDGTNLRTAQHLADIVNDNAGRGQLNVNPSVGGVTGILPRANHHASLTNAIDASSNLLTAFRFGSNATQNFATGVITIASGGASTGNSYVVPSGEALCAYAIITRGGTSGGAALIIGTATNGYAVVASGTTYTIVRYSGGTPTTLNTLATGQTMDTSPHTYRISIVQSSPTQYLIEGSIDGFGVAGLVDNSPPSGIAAPVVTVEAGSTGGTMLDFIVKPRNLWTDAALPYRSTIGVTADGNGNYLNTGTVGTNQLLTACITNAKMAGNSVQQNVIQNGTLDLTVSALWANKNLDNVADGTTRFAVAAVNSSNYPTIIAGHTTGVGGGCQLGSGGPTLVSNAGAPSGAPTGGQGSLYSNTTGAAGARWYYRTGASTWAADTGL